MANRNGLPHQTPAVEPAHQFDDLKQQHDSTNLGMWSFLVTEIMFFGALFIAYIVYRTAYPHAFAEGSHHLDVLLGGVNTVVLISSSLTMALAVAASSEGKNKQTGIFLILTIVLGLAFLGIKAVEYTHKFHEHLVPGAHFAPHGAQDPMHMQIFFSLYFAMTGMHALHMIIGIGTLSVLTVMAFLGKFSKDYYSPIELTGLYWHFVDIVWIFLFPLLYLIGRHG